jgi:hypothetical protein
MTQKTTKGLFHPCYFATIAQYSLLVKCAQFSFEIHDHYQKQTYRNRCFIYAQQGRQHLNVPVKRSSEGKQITKNVKIDYSENWQQQHFRTIKTAYNTSPFFEFFEDDLLKIYSKKQLFLLDLNLETHQFVMSCLDHHTPYNFTESYENQKVEFDFRELVNSKKKMNYSFEEYPQNFVSANEFIPNLSILDLLFMEGPQAFSYLLSTHFDTETL